LQLGEAVDGEKPRRASIPKGTDPNTIELENALRLLSLPREVGIHPESGKPIVANFGRFGPFILHDGSYANLDSGDEVFTVGINRAVDILAQKKARGFTRARPGALKDLGVHPEGGGSIQIMSGRYGPYVKFGKINATLPRGADPQSYSLEEAIALIAAKAGNPTGKKKSAAKKAPAKKVSAKKPGTKKSSSKKPRKTAAEAST
jgi:DNA topoisomerase-1